MSTNLSSNSLFHFTSLDGLKGILRNNFFPRFSIEENFFLKDGVNTTWAIPMVCFCDIPLSQIHNHTEKFGKYAIGLTKEWGMANGISPILYTHQQSYITKNLQEHFEQGEKILTEIPVHNSPNLPKLWDSYVYTTFYIKPYEGNMVKKNLKNVRFYDEREWRFIPEKEKLNSIMGRGFGETPFLSPTQYNDAGILQEYNQKLADNCPLKFEPKYITYIIVSEESEILTIKRDIEQIKSPYPNDVELLTTRIMTLKQINADF